MNPAIPGADYAAYSSVETAVEALKTGALDYLIKPLDFDNLQATLEKALAHTQVLMLKHLTDTASQFGIVGKSPAMQHLLSEIALVAPSEATVQIHGDSGAVKSWSPGRFTPVARVAKKPLVTLNCGAQRCWNLNCSVTKKGRLLEPINTGKGALSRRTAARCFSMKLAIYLADDAGASAACDSGSARRSACGWRPDYLG
ncbi:sigma 54-interacting transcriptional regulator [Escherichia coli]